MKKNLAVALLVMLALVVSIQSYAYTDDDIIGTYTGSYYATQGHTGLTLEIFKEDGQIQGIFNFYAIPDNPKLPAGSYKCDVVFDSENNKIDVLGTEWINQPNGWSFVNLSGELNNNVYSGDVSFTMGIKKYEFEVKRQADEDIISTWASEDVNLAIINSLVPLDVQGDYTSNITRKNFTKIMIAFLELYMDTSIEAFIDNYSGELMELSFDDTDDEAVLSAGSLGIITGYGNGQFGPDDHLTREQAAVILTRLSAVIGADVFVQNKGDYLDYNAFSNWAEDGINYVSQTYDPVTESYVMSGYEQKFHPKDGYTVEQSIITIFRLYHVMQEN